jgi:hypothetical protein
VFHQVGRVFSAGDGTGRDGVTRGPALVSTVIGKDPSVGGTMSVVRGLVKSAVAVKIAQVAQRELSKPENQRKIKEGLRKVQDKVRRSPA